MVDKTEYKVLFVGNSYTFYNELWNIFKEIANGEGFSTSVDQVTAGGYKLSQMLDENDDFGKTLKQKLETQKYDVVFLQEQSLTPMLNKSAFFESVKNLKKLIDEKVGAKIILYQTWGRKEGCSSIPEGFTAQQTSQQIIGAYEELAKTLNIGLSPVGKAFYETGVSYPEIELYDPDKSHPSKQGSYLAGLCHYATVFQKSPVGVKYRYELSEEEALKLQKIANSAINATK